MRFLKTALGLFNMDLKTWTSLYLKPQFYIENKTDEYLLLHWMSLISKNELQAGAH